MLRKSRNESASEGPRRLHAFVSGMVQGVGYRAFTRSAATRLGLVGTVRNLRDGRVEVVAEGRPETLAALLDSLREGPWGARVGEIEVSWGEATREFQSFGVSFAGRGLVGVGA